MKCGEKCDGQMLSCVKKLTEIKSSGLARRKLWNCFSTLFTITTNRQQLWAKRFTGDDQSAGTIQLSRETWPHLMPISCFWPAFTGFSSFPDKCLEVSVIWWPNHHLDLVSRADTWHITEVWCPKPPSNLVSGCLAWPFLLVQLYHLQHLLLRWAAADYCRTPLLGDE